MHAEASQGTAKEPRLWESYFFSLLLLSQASISEVGAGNEGAEGSGVPGEH